MIKGPQPPSSPKEDRMHRVRVGLTGLAAVGLIVLLATFVFSRIGTNTPATKRSAEATTHNKTKDQPLAELGIAPATSDTDKK